MCVAMIDRLPGQRNVTGVQPLNPQPCLLCAAQCILGRRQSASRHINYELLRTALMNA
jgi:hypothetical protein